MLERVEMKTSQERLRWAVAFAVEDLSQFRPGDWLNLREDLWRFMGAIDQRDASRAEAAFLASPSKFPVQASEQEITAVQTDTRALLERADPGEQSLASPASPLVLSVRWSFMPAGMGLLEAAGSWRDLFLTRLVFLLASAGVSKIRRCPAPGCGRLFWKSGRRKYCSQRCTNRATFAAWKTTEKGRTRSKRQVEAARKARKQYQKHPKALARLRARRNAR